MSRIIDILFVAFLIKTGTTSAVRPEDIENQVVRIIIKSYIDDFVKEMRANEQATLDHKVFQERMEGLYDHIKNHPALNQRYFWAGHGKPTEDPDEWSSSGERGHRQRKDFSRYAVQRRGWKRNGMQSYPPEEACATTMEWQQINTTKDYEGNDVDIVQDEIKQYVYFFKCVNVNKPCKGISPLYTSECTERKGYMTMYYRPTTGEDRSSRWGYVAVNHHCACKVTPLTVP